MDIHPLISIIIPVYRDWQRLELCLQALHAQSLPQEQLEVIVVNNDPEHKPWTRSPLANLEIITEARPGSYAARNAGIRAAKGDLLGFCDADCIPDPDWLKTAASFLQARQDISRLAGRIELIYEDSTNPSLAEKHERVFAFRQDWHVQSGAGVTANMFAWRQVFDEVGLFEETLLSGGDLEWGHRAHKAGFVIAYLPEAVVWHPARYSEQQLRQKARRVCSGYIRVNKADIRKNPLNALYHGLCMLKPPIKAGKMIFARQDLRLRDKILVYFLEYYLKLVQFGEYVKCQSGFRP